MSLRMLVCALTFVVVVTIAPSTASTTQADPDWEMICGGQVRPMAKKLKFRPGRDSATAKDSIQLCTKHVYEFSGKAGQQISARLSTGDRTRMMLFPVKGDGLFVAQRQWEGILPQNGKYRLTVVTARNAEYTLEMSFKVNVH